MRCATHADALKSIFEGAAHPLTAPAIMASKISLTPEVMREYQGVLGNNHGFQAWFAAAQQSNRLIVKLPVDAPKCFSALHAHSMHYGVSSYFAGSQLFANAQSMSKLDIAGLSRLGIRVSDISAAPAQNIPGDNPVFSISLVNQGTVDFSLFDNFLFPEERIIIYDKYIDEAAMEFIEYVARRLAAGAELHVRTTSLGSTCKTTHEISQRLSAANGRLNHTCKEVSKSFRKLAHDRYVFFGARLQAVFTAGLGCFGVAGGAGIRSNKQSKINLYASDGVATMNIESQDGSVLTTPCADGYSC